MVGGARGGGGAAPSPGVLAGALGPGITLGACPAGWLTGWLAGSLMGYALLAGWLACLQGGPEVVAIQQPEHEDEAAGEQLKLKANQFFAAGDYEGAAKLYTLALEHWTKWVFCGCFVSFFAGTSSMPPCLQGRHSRRSFLVFLLLSCSGEGTSEVAAAQLLAEQGLLPACLAVWLRNATYFGNRAACYLKLGRYEEALSDARLARAVDPHYVKAWWVAELPRRHAGRLRDARRTQHAHGRSHTACWRSFCFHLGSGFLSSIPLIYG